MSTHNPYEPTEPAAQRDEAPAPTLDLDPTTGPELKQELPAAPESGETVPEGTVKEIMDWVGTDKKRAGLAITAENAREDARPSLINRLSKVRKA